MDVISSALGSLSAIVWGDEAVASLDASLVCENYMLVVDDTELDTAAQLFRKAGFRDAPWSYGSRQDPAIYADRKMQDIHRRVAQQYSTVDKNSVRFLFPTEDEGKARVVLLPSSYTHITVTPATEDRFSREGNILYPDAAMLLESFVRTLVSEPGTSSWTSNLRMWIITYLYGELMLGDDVLDSCDDEEARKWFDENIRRYAGGIDRTTCTKRLGRVGYDENLAKEK